MDAMQDRVLQTFRRALGWLAANLQNLVRGNPASERVLVEQRDVLNGVVSRATEYVTQQNAQFAHSSLTSKDEKAKRSALLKNHMLPVHKVVRALIGKIPGIGVLLVPRVQLKTSTLITTAVEMARKAEPYQEVLIQHGLATDFVQQLDESATELKVCLDARGQARARRRGASEGLKLELAKGRAALGVLDATLSNVLRSDPAKLAEWKQLQRVTLKGRPAATAAQRAANAAQASLQGVQSTSGTREPPAGSGKASASSAETASDTVQAAPSSVQATPSSVQVTPNIVQMTPNSVQVTPSAVQVTPGAVQVTPNAGQPTSTTSKKVA